MPEGADVILYIVLAPFAAVFLYGLYARLSSYGLKSIFRILLENPKGFMMSILEFGWAQRRILREKKAGVMHLLISYGALTLLIGTTLVFIDHDIMRPLQARLLVGDFYLLYELLLDTFGILFIAGLLYALLRRTYLRPGRLSYKREYTSLLLLLLFIGFTGFILEGVRIYLRSPEWGIYSPVGALLASLMIDLNFDRVSLEIFYRGVWWIHAIASFGGIAALPFTNLLHIVASSLNVAVSRRLIEAPGKIETPFILSQLSVESPLPSVGIGRVSDLKPRQILQLDACTDCGRCDEVCPALIAGTPLSPRSIVQKLRRAWWEKMEVDLLDSKTFTLDEVFACTNCGACEYACPVLISPMELIIELRRALAIQGKVTKRGVETLSSLARTRNPFGMRGEERVKLLRELEQLGAKSINNSRLVETVYWVGCMGVYDPRARQIVKQVVSLLVSAGVEFAVICSEEVCNGDPARRLGEEGRYQELAEDVIRLLESKGVKHVITHCPHCYDTLARQYKDLGAKFKVTSHIALFQKLAREGKIKLATTGRLTIHDSCIFSRMHGLVEEPRLILKGLEVHETRRTRRETFCCGAGGGNYWLDIKRVRRENLIRLEELLETGAETIVTECPFCLAMLEDAKRVLGIERRVSIKEISELFRPAEVN
ncbi:MAG: (Fe-S)-binding protein [Nitrososphaerota archaeon]|nr:(Fe-S)-binding protein [Candidatus Calditenuaceae archaeon]MDW8073077.1 (Fe-S)-binding protein [Nitrososphaerota archaeon]